MCVPYIRGCSVHRGDIMSTSGEYHEYIGGCSVHRGYHDVCEGISWIHRGDVQYIGGYHEYIRGISWVHRGCSVHWGKSWCMWGSKLVRTFQFLLKTSMYWTSPDVLMISPHLHHDIPRCTHGIPMYSWYPDVLMISPTYIMISPDVLNTPRCTHDISRCTHRIPSMYWTPPMYWTSLNVLNTHYTGWLRPLGKNMWKRRKVTAAMLSVLQCICTLHLESSDILWTWCLFQKSCRHKF